MFLIGKCWFLLRCFCNWSIASWAGLCTIHEASNFNVSKGMSHRISADDRKQFAGWQHWKLASCCACLVERLCRLCCKRKCPYGTLHFFVVVLLVAKYLCQITLAALCMYSTLCLYPALSANGHLFGMWWIKRQLMDTVWIRDYPSPKAISGNQYSQNEFLPFASVQKQDTSHSNFCH